MTTQKKNDWDLSGPVEQGKAPVPVGGSLAEPIDREALSGNQIATVEKITKANVARLIANAEALIEFTNKVELLALKRTTSEDWVLLGEKPYLTDSGVKRVLKILGSSIFDVTIETEHGQTEGGKRVIYYTATGKIRDYQGEVYENVGTSSTRDKFFAKRKQKKMKDGVVVRENDRDVYEEIELPIDDIDLQNVKKKAVTNLHHRLIDCVVNIRPTVEKLKGIGIEPKSSVTYGKGTKGGTTDTPQEAKDRTELRSLLEKISRETGRDLTALTREVTAFSNFKGFDNPESVTVKSLPFAMRAAKALFEKTPGAKDSPAAATPAKNGKTTPAANGAKSKGDENAQPPDDDDPSLPLDPNR